MASLSALGSWGDNIPVFYLHGKEGDTLIHFYTFVWYVVIPLPYTAYIQVLSRWWEAWQRQIDRYRNPYMYNNGWASVPHHAMHVFVDQLRLMSYTESRQWLGSTMCLKRWRTMCVMCVRRRRNILNHLVTQRQETRFKCFWRGSFTVFEIGIYERRSWSLNVVGWIIYCMCTQVQP